MFLLGLVLGSMLVLPILALLHLQYVDNKRISIRWKINDYYITNIRKYDEKTEWIDVILDFCNETKRNPSKICKEFPATFLEKQPTIEALF
jgi:hypothetical protein